MKSRILCATVKDEFSNYQAKFNTPAKLNNFSLSMEQVDALAGQIARMLKIPQFLDFKSGCADIVSYIANIEYIDLGEAFKAELDAAKAEFRSIRDSIMDGVPGETAAKKVDAILSKVKAKYIDPVFVDMCKLLGKMSEFQDEITLAQLRQKLFDEWGERTTLFHWVISLTTVTKMTVCFPSNSGGFNTNSS